METKGVFFDLYGTLVVFKDVNAAWQSWLTALHTELVECGLAMGKAEFAARCDGFFSKPEPPPADDGFTVYERRMSAHLSELGLNLEPEQLKRAAIAGVRAWQRHGRIDPEARTVLESLGRTRKIVLVSNFDQGPHVHALLEDEGLTPYFDLIVVSDDVGLKKPDPRIFDLALEQVGLSPGEVVHIGDMDDDILGAQAAGITPVLIRRESVEALIPDFRVGGRPADYAAGDSDGVPVVPALSALEQLLR